MDKLEHLTYGMVDSQFRLNCKNMVAINPENLSLRLNVRTLGRVYEQRKELAGYYMANQQACQSLVDYMTEQTTRIIYGLNQFVNLTRRESRALKVLYWKLVRATMDALDSVRFFETFTEDLSNIVVRHSSLLRHFLLAIYDSDLISSGNSRPIACIEYSPTLQIQLLGVNVSNLREPILDIGCGINGQLVRQLRAWGYKAHGVDRSVIDHPHLIHADWSDFPWLHETWGTIVSHMAFSNHFNHHHLRTNGQPGAYAKTFMHTLKALKRGGSFYYAPGLPFIEELLPGDKYRIIRVRDEMQKGFYSSQVVRLE
ncbi:MAG: class I SAM-dependent methyltransferase [Bacilli bacterium]